MIKKKNPISFQAKLFATISLKMFWFLTNLSVTVNINRTWFSFLFVVKSLFSLLLFYFVLFYWRKHHTFYAWRVSNYEDKSVLLSAGIDFLFFRSQWLFKLKRLKIRTLDSDFAIWVRNIGSFENTSNKILTFPLYCTHEWSLHCLSSCITINIWPWNCRN